MDSQCDYRALFESQSFNRSTFLSTGRAICRLLNLQSGDKHVSELLCPNI